MPDAAEPKRWAVTLRLTDSETLEGRAAPIVEYLAKHEGHIRWMVKDLDATGSLGGNLTQRVNQDRVLFILSAQLLDVLKEDGQIIELAASWIRDDDEILRIIIRDGRSIDILGTGHRIPPAVLGDHSDEDVGMFWPSL